MGFEFGWEHTKNDLSGKKTMKKKTISLILVCGFVLLFHLADAREDAYMVTYGPKAGTIEGDNDFLQVVFFKIPETGSADRLFLRLFDPDCGGLHDARYYGKYDTVTRFKLFGGMGAYTSPGLIKPSPGQTESSSGVLLGQKDFGEDTALDGKWRTAFEFKLNDGEKVDGNRYFRLIIGGVSGDDGNRFMVAVSEKKDSNLPPGNLEMFTYSPTVNLPRRGIFSEIPFYVPKGNRQITVHNFDLANANLGVNTAFRENLPVKSSGQNEWKKSTVTLEERETGRMCAIRFEGGREIPNDGSFYVTDTQGRPLRAILPAHHHVKNERAMPKAAFDYSDQCNTVSFDASETADPEGDPLAFIWKFGDGTTGNGIRTTHEYGSPGVYDVELTVEDENGQVFNSVTHTFRVNVNHPPVAEAGPDVIAAPGEKVGFDATGSEDPDGKIKGRHWDFGDGKTSARAKTTHIYKSPGKYAAILKITDDSGHPCDSSEDTRLVTVNARPVANAGGGKIASPNEPVEFSGAGSADSDGTIVSHNWDFGDGSNAEGVAVSHTYKKPGTYTVVLRVTDDSGAKNNVGKHKIKVMVNDAPVADAGSDRKAAVGETVVFDASGSKDADGRLIEYKWDFGDGTVETVRETVVRHAYGKPGLYNVVLEVRDDSGSTSAASIDETRVFVNDPPTANAGPGIYTTNGEVTLDGSMSEDRDGKIIRHTWDFGDGSTGGGQNPVHVYRSPGVYTVRLTVTDDSGTSSATDSDETAVSINHPPIADAGPDLTGIPGRALRFNGSASVDPDGKIVSHDWDFGDGTSGSEETVSHAYEKPGAYDVLLTVRDESGHEQAVGYDHASVRINHPPVADAGPDRSAAPGQEIVFDAGASYDPDGEIQKFQWAFSDGKTYQSSGLRRIFDSPGTYGASLEVADADGLENSTARAQVTIRVNHRPTANAGRPVHTNNRTVSLDGSGSTDADGDSLAYQWDFGDGSEKVSGMKAVHTYKKGGSYPVILTVDDGTGLANSKSATSVTVKIDEPPIADAGGNIRACAGKIVIFDGAVSIDPEGGIMKYHWDFGDGTQANGVDPTKIYPFGGVYQVTLAVTDDSGLEGNTGVDRIMVKVAESPVANAGEDLVACAGSPVEFDGNGSTDLDGLVNAFQWDFGDGAIGGGPTPSHIYSKAGVYRVVLLITGDQLGDCDNTDTDEIMVTVHEAPVVEVAASELAAPGVPIQLHAVTDGDSLGTGVSMVGYDWDLGDGSKAEGESVEHVYASSGDYLVTLKATSDAGTDCDQAVIRKQIVVNAAPLAKIRTAGQVNPDTGAFLFGVDQAIPFDGSGSEDPDGVISHWLWDFGDGRTASGSEARHQYASPGQYEVTLKVTDCTELPNNTVTDSVTVKINASPVPAIEAKRVACPGEPVVFSAGKSHDADSIIAEFEWQFGDGSGETGVETEHAYKEPGTYMAVLAVDDGEKAINSRASASVEVRVNAPPVAVAGRDRVVSTNEDIVFDASGSFDTDGGIVSYEWDFGDGTVSGQANATHRFDAPGIYTARLTVTDDSGPDCECRTGSDEAAIRVNAPPVAKAGGDRTVFCGGANDAVLFDASASNDPDGDVLTFHWDFGDGHTAKGPKVSHTYRVPGKYTATLRVNDGTGLKSGIAEDTALIDVRPHE